HASSGSSARCRASLRRDRCRESTRRSRRSARTWLPESADELVRLAANRRIEHEHRVIVVRDAQQVALALEHETGALEVGARASRVDTMQPIDDDARIARLADEVDDADDAARLHGAIERGEHVFR